MNVSSILLLASRLEVDVVETPPAVTPSAVSGRAVACSEDDQLCTVSEIPFESFLRVRRALRELPVRRRLQALQDPVLVFLLLMLPSLGMLVSLLELSTLRMRLQMRARESWNCVR